MLKAMILQALGETDLAGEIEARAEFLPEANWTGRSEVDTPSPTSTGRI